jgi:predicted nucleic acid-binding Zn ribbon protein
MPAYKIKCALCGEIFENFTPFNKHHSKKYCDVCLMKLRRERNYAYSQRVKK